MTENNRKISRRPATRRSQLLETLENRQLMAAFSANFNFQPASSAKPAGYVADIGKSFSTQGSYQYGWNASNTSNVVDRNTSADARYDTFAYLGKSGVTKWEVAVPNGTYRVNITAGDASSTSAHYALKVENSQLINETPSKYNRWSEGSGTVTVTDGRLTLTSGTGAYNNKINSIAVKQLTSTTSTGSSGAAVSAPKAPSWAGTWSVKSTSLTLGWGDVSTNESGFIIEQSTNGTSFNEIARVAANTQQTNVNSLSPGRDYYYRVRSYNANGSVASNVTRARTTGTATAETPVTPVTVIPGRPSSIGSTATNASSGRITWADSSNNETGFIVQKSTNNSTFSEAGRVGANTTSFTASGLSASTKYYFRVLAYNAAGNSAASSVGSFTTSAATTSGNSGGSTGGTTGNTGAITNKLSLSGISANTNGDPASKYVEILNDVGIKNVRIWYSHTNWNAQPDTWYINRAIGYKNAGYKVMLAVLNPNVPSSEAQAKTFFNRLTSYPGLTGAVDYWQINNEPNMGSFWHGSLSQYVKLNLKPAYEVLKAKGEVVVGAGPSWDVNAAKTLTANGYLDYCDYAAFHPYGENANIVIQRARDARTAFNNKPMMVTEWNIQGVSNQTNWVTELNKAAIGLSNIAAMNYYFALKQSATHVGVGGLLKYDGSKNTLFYNAVKGWLD